MMGAHARAVELRAGDSYPEMAVGAKRVHLGALVGSGMMHAALVLGEALHLELATLTVGHARVRLPVPLVVRFRFF